ncbi:MAG TPA: DUF4367 domain-containing protein [Candidatus Nitrosotalea sp.]|nr:DUF4367 domain-containing protein [Candidatus Nitrosotalea sp.]
MKPFGASSFYPIIKERWKNAIKINNESQATSIAGYEIKFPSEFPSDYSLQFGVVEVAPDDGRFACLFYSKEPLTDSMRFNEFFKQKGIWINYRKWVSSSSKEGSFDFHIQNHLQTLKKEGIDGCEITINGHKGMASSQQDRLFHGVDVHDPSQVEFVTKETHITLQGYLAKEELIKVAESI